MPISPNPGAPGYAWRRFSFLEKGLWIGWSASPSASPSAVVISAVVGNRERQVDDGPPAVEQHGARAALTVVAALLRRGNSEPISKRVQEDRASVNDYRSILTVHSQGDLCVHPTPGPPHYQSIQAATKKPPASWQMHATSRDDACRSHILHQVDVWGALTDWPTTEC